MKDERIPKFPQVQMLRRWAVNAVRSDPTIGVVTFPKRTTS